MTNNELSPEEKLLHLIKKEPAKTVEQKNSEKPPDFDSTPQKKIPLNSVVASVNVSKINNVLVGTIILLGILLVLQLTFHVWKTVQLSYINTGTSVFSFRKDSTPFPEEKLSKLERDLKKKQLFKVFYVTEQKEVIQKQKTPLAEILKHMQLSGIIMEDSPTAILYDMKTRQNTYMHIGDTYQGLEIIAITNNSVTFAHDEDELELSL